MQREVKIQKMVKYAEDSQKYRGWSNIQREVKNTEDGQICRGGWSNMKRVVKNTEDGQICRGGWSNMKRVAKAVNHHKLY
jgi:hypothetical protein